MKKSIIIKVSVIFLVGFLSANLINLYFISGFEIPLSLDYFGFSKNLSAPFDFIDEDQIKIYDDRIVIFIEDASLSRYAPTGSMLPVLDNGANGIRVQPSSEDKIHIGDIITFKRDNYLIVHRVIDIGTDSEGVYFITKGDNNSISDGKVRFKDVEYLTVGVIW